MTVMFLKLLMIKEIFKVLQLHQELEQLSHRFLTIQRNYQQFPLIFLQQVLEKIQLLQFNLELF